MTLSSSVCWFFHSVDFPETFGDSYPCIWDSVTFCWLPLVLVIQEAILISYCSQQEWRWSRTHYRTGPSVPDLQVWVQQVIQVLPGLTDQGSYMQFSHGNRPFARPKLVSECKRLKLLGCSCCGNDNESPCWLL